MAGWLWPQIVQWFEHFWLAIVACILPQPTSTPASKLRTGTKASGSKSNHKARSEAGWQPQNDQFLRHPSLRLKSGGENHTNDPGKATSEKVTRKSKPIPIIVTPANSSQVEQMGSSFDPPKSPLSPPAVIVTPSSPSGGRSDVSGTSNGTPSPAIPTPVANLTFMRPTSLELVKIGNNSKDSARLSHSNPLPGSLILRDLEKGIFELDSPPIDAFRPESYSTPRLPPRLSWSYAVTPPQTPAPTPNQSNSLPRSVGDAHPWGDPNLTADQGFMDDPSYITSTPPKKRSEGVFGVQRIQEDYESFGNTTATPSTSSDNGDSVPYPDVFDLDMYSDSVRTSLQTSDTSDHDFSSRESVPLALLIASRLKKTNPAQKEKRFAFVPSDSQNSPAKDNEVKRYRDHYRPTHYSRPPRLCAGEPVSPKSSKMNPIANYDGVRSFSFDGLGTSESFRSGSPEDARFPPGLHNVNDRMERPIVPLVIVSQYSCDGEAITTSTIPSHYSAVWEAAPPSNSLEDLKARLKETQNNFAKSIYVEDSVAWEPVPF